MSRKILAIGLALVVSCFESASAKPLQTDQLPTGAHWVLHVDGDAVADSPTLRSAIQQLLASPTLEPYVRDFDFAIEAEWHWLTAYALDEERIVALMHSSLSSRDLLPRLRQETGFAEVNYGRHVVQHWVMDPRNDQGLFSKLLQEVGANDQRGDTDRDAENRDAANGAVANGDAKRKDDQKKDDEKKPQTTYACFYAPQLLVVASRLDDLLKQLDVMDGKEKSMDTKGIATKIRDEPITFQYHRLPTVGTERADVDEPTCLHLIVGGRDKIHVDTTWDLGSVLMANLVMNYARPESLIQLVRSVVEKAKQAEENAAKNEDATDDIADSNDGPNHGRIMLGADFEGLDFDEDRDEILAFLRDSMQADRAGQTVHLRWSSHAFATMNYTAKGGFHDLVFKLHLLTDKQYANRLAEQNQQKLRR